MQALDTINRQFGSHTLKFASEGTTKTWQMSLICCLRVIPPMLNDPQKYIKAAIHDSGNY